MYFEFLLRRAHSRKRVERKYWSGESLYSRTTCSNSVIVGVTGPIGSGLPQFGFPRRFAMNYCLSIRGNMNCKNYLTNKILQRGVRILGKLLDRVDKANSSASTRSRSTNQETCYSKGVLLRKSTNFWRSFRLLFFVTYCK